MVDEGNERLSTEVHASVEKNALLNAIRHAGKADVGAVVSKVIGEFPDLRKKPKEVAKAVLETVRRINSLEPQAQEKTLKEKYPEASPEPKQKEGRIGLPPLQGAVKGSVVLRLPPEPSGFMHIGHAMAGTVNYIYKQQYDGLLWLRFEDTNPRKVAKKYYDSFRNGYEWLGIEWDREKSVSTDLEVIYDHARRLLEKGRAYACGCDPEKVKKFRFEGKVCEHRDATVEKNLAIWDGMLAKKYGEGDYVIRLKGDMASLDYSLRDPNIMRIINHEHPVTGSKYVVWPAYDLEVVIEDEICGVTHILRSSEFHVALQELMRKLLAFRPVNVNQFSRYNFRGTPVSKRLLRPLVEKGLVQGWDDPRMPTIEGVRRRGIVSEAIREFTLQVGYSKTEHEYDWSLLLSVNRKILDPRSKRLFFVPSPVKLRVEGAEQKKRVELPFHPENDLGSRTVDVGSEFSIPSADATALKEGDLFRLMDLYNVKVISKSDSELRASFEGEERIPQTRKTQWVGPGSVSIQVLEPSALYDDLGNFNENGLKIRDGLAEPSFNELSLGEIIQFPRYGFCRVDGKNRCVLTQ